MEDRGKGRTGRQVTGRGRVRNEPHGFRGARQVAKGAMAMEGCADCGGRLLVIFRAGCLLELRDVLTAMTDRAKIGSLGDGCGGREDEGKIPPAKPEIGYQRTITPTGWRRR